MGELQQLNERQKMVQKNLNAAKETNEKQKQSIKDMKALILTQKGSSKKQLQKVLKTKEDDDKDQDLEDFLKEGRSYLKSLDEKV